jgi:predicted MFS family arabinose efflux permease
MVPLVAADLTAGSGRFNLVQGAIGLAVGLGATLSTTLAGAAFDAFGHRVGFLCLAAAGAACVALVAAAMPETRGSHS